MKKRTIFLRGESAWAEVPEDVYCQYMRISDAHRKRMQDHKRCFCPVDNRNYCDTDCAVCKYYNKGVDESLDAPVMDDGRDVRLDRVVTQTYNTDKQAICNIILQRAEELLPGALQIALMRVHTLTYQEIADRMGVPRTTLVQRLKVLRKKLLKEFPDIFDD